MSKLQTFLKTKKIDARRILVASNQLDGLTPDDRAVKWARAHAKDSNASDALKEKAGKKPRSGRTVSEPALARALGGEAVTGPTKTRILRALNSILAQKKQGEVTLKDLF